MIQCIHFGKKSSWYHHLRPLYNAHVRFFQTMPVRYMTSMDAASTIQEDDLYTAHYYFENGLRKVKPYYFHFRAYAKERMYGKTVLEVFLREYRGRSEGYYRRAIERGLIRVNGQESTPNTILGHHDTISHFVHRHEPPVTDQSIETLYEDEGMIVVNKPGSIQAHPTGRYRHNTLLHIMRKEMGYDRLFPCNRLDRMTSGIMIICKNKERADKVASQMRLGKIQKEYICRVSGEFPEKPILCNEPIKKLGYTVSLNYVHPEGKASTTLFTRLHYNHHNHTSLIKCQPLTGRTHQIRVHLRYLGFPIANDPIYGPHTAWSDRLSPHEPLTDQDKITTIFNTMIETAPFDYMDDDPLNKSNLPRCGECNVPVTQTDPLPSELCLWLHAYKYSGDDWSFTTENKWPDWAMHA